MVNHSNHTSTAPNQEAQKRDNLFKSLRDLGYGIDNDKIPCEIEHKRG